MTGRERPAVALLRATHVPLLDAERLNLADVIDALAAERDAAFLRGWEAGRDAAAALCDARAAVVDAVFPANEETQLADRARGGVSALQTTAAELRALTPPETGR